MHKVSEMSCSQVTQPVLFATNSERKRRSCVREKRSRCRPHYMLYLHHIFTPTTFAESAISSIQIVYPTIPTAETKEQKRRRLTEGKAEKPRKLEGEGEVILLMKCIAWLGLLRRDGETCYVNEILDLTCFFLFFFNPNQRRNQTTQSHIKNTHSTTIITNITPSPSQRE